MTIQELEILVWTLEWVVKISVSPNNHLLITRIQLVKHLNRDSREVFQLWELEEMMIQMVILVWILEWVVITSVLLRELLRITQIQKVKHLNKRFREVNKSWGQDVMMIQEVDLWVLTWLLMVNLLILLRNRKREIITMIQMVTLVWLWILVVTLRLLHRKIRTPTRMMIQMVILVCTSRWMVKLIILLKSIEKLILMRTTLFLSHTALLN